VNSVIKEGMSRYITILNSFSCLEFELLQRVFWLFFRFSNQSFNFRNQILQEFELEFDLIQLAFGYSFAQLGWTR